MAGFEDSVGGELSVGTDSTDWWLPIHKDSTDVGYHILASNLSETDSRYHGVWRVKTEAQLTAAIAASAPLIVVTADITLTSTKTVNYAMSLVSLTKKTITINHSGSGFTITAGASGRVLIAGVIFDGNTVANRAFTVVSAERATITNCTFDDFDSDSNLYAVLITDVGVLNISNCVFSNMRCLSSGGAVRGLMFTGEVLAGTVQNCKFININTRDAGGTDAYGDADAIFFQTGTDFQNITVDSCYFEDIGKRAFKIQAPTTNIYKLLNNTIVSSYTGTTDDVGTTGNGMQSCFYVAGGKVTIENNVLKSGVCGFFVEVSIVGASSYEPSALTIKNNRYYPEYHNYVNGGKTQFIYVPSTVTTLEEIIVEGNYGEACYEGITLEEGNVAKVMGNELDVINYGIDVDTPIRIVTDNKITQSTEAVEPGGSRGINITNGLTAGIFRGNYVNGKEYGIVFGGQTGSFKASIVGNVIIDPDSAAKSIYLAGIAGSESNITVLGNIDNKTLGTAGYAFIAVPTGTTVGAAGGASALPANPTGYMVTYINGTAYRIPYYAAP